MFCHEQEVVGSSHGGQHDTVNSIGCCVLFLKCLSSTVYTYINVYVCCIVHSYWMCLSELLHYHATLSVLTSTLNTHGNHKCVLTIRTL